MSEFLARYSQREKMIVALAALFLVLILLHSQVIEPYQLRLVELQDEIEQQRSDLEWMKSAVVSMPATVSASSSAAISGTLTAFIDQAVRRQGLAEQLSQMSPVGEDEIRMRYSSVDFNRLIGFIAEVNTSGLEIKDLRITAGDDPGVVNCSLVLMRS